MKKMGIVIFICILSLVACQSQSKVSDDPASIIENHNFSEEFNDIGLFWTYTFDDMYISVSFRKDNPQKYYAQHILDISQIKTIQIYPDKNDTSQFIYMIYNEGAFQIDQDDIAEYKNQGRDQAYALYQQKIEKLSLTTENIGQWMIEYFNDHVRLELITLAKKDADELIQKIEKKGYKYKKEETGRKIIYSDKVMYKIVMSANNCMIVDQKMDLTGGPKTGYMYNATLGSVGYLKDDQVMISYRYKDNTVLQGRPTQTQYIEFMNIKKWYDTFLVEMDTDTMTLENL